MTDLYVKKSFDFRRGSSQRSSVSSNSSNGDRFDKSDKFDRFKKELALTVPIDEAPPVKTLVKNLNLNYIKPQRAGVIIYTVVNDAIYFGMGLDSKTHDITDFGGGVIYDIDKDAIQGALREFHEETLQIFEPINAEDIKDCPVIYDKYNLIVFIHLEVYHRSEIKLNPNQVSDIFNRKYRAIVEQNQVLKLENKYGNLPIKHKFYYPEVCGITWLSFQDFRYSINNKGILFSRVRDFLFRAGNFEYLL